jgi:hypothetical protein
MNANTPKCFMELLPLWLMTGAVITKRVQCVKQIGDRQLLHTGVKICGKRSGATDAQFIPVILAIVPIVAAALKWHHSDQVAFRRDLLAQYTEVTDRIKLMTKELDEWKDKYLGLSEDHLKLKTRYMNIDTQLEDLGKESIEFQAKYKAIQSTLEELQKDHLDIQTQCQAMGVQLEDIKHKYLPKEEWQKYKYSEDDTIN